MKKLIKIICICLVLILSMTYIHKVQGLSIVGYHGVVSDEEKKTIYKDNHYYISVSQFERHMKYLYDHHYQTLSMQEVEDYYYHRIDINKKSKTQNDNFKNNEMSNNTFCEFKFNLP